MTAVASTLVPAPRKSLEPWIPDSVEYYPWQVRGIRDCCRRKSFLLADEMGLGKSIQALTTFAVDVKLGLATTAIVIAPATLKANWADEVEKFTRIPYLVLGQEVNSRGKLVSLSPEQRERQLVAFALQDGPRILITNYEQIKPHLKTLNDYRFDVAIFDEAHFMKNHLAQRTKACHRLRAKRNFVLTGSPLLNHVDELWSLLHKIDPGRFPKYWPFVMRYAVFGGYKDKQIIGVKNEAELNRILAEYMIRRLAKDCLPLDEPQIIPRIVDLHPRQKELYDEIVDDMRLTISGDEKQDIENALTKFLKLKQICGTTATVLSEDEDYSHKLDLAIEDDMALLRAGEKIVVFTQFRGVQNAYTKRLARELEKEKLSVPVFVLHGGVAMHERVPTVKEWESIDGAAVICCMLQVAGIGLNMTAAHHGSFLDKLFVPKLNEQAIARLNRLGQKFPVQIREYRVRGTIETRVEQILRLKSGIFNNVIEAANYKKLLLMVMKAAEEDEPE